MELTLEDRIKLNREQRKQAKRELIKHINELWRLLEENLKVKLTELLEDYPNEKIDVIIDNSMDNESVCLVVSDELYNEESFKKHRCDTITLNFIELFPFYSHYFITKSHSLYDETESITFTIKGKEYKD